MLTFAFLGATLVTTTGQFYGSPHAPLLMSAAVAAGIGICNKVRWSEIQECIATAYSDVAAAILVTLLIGVIIAMWIAGK